MSELLAKLRQHLHIPKALRPNADELLLECLHAIERLEYEQLILDTKRSIANLAFQEAAAMKRGFPLDTRPSPPIVDGGKREPGK